MLTMGLFLWVLFPNMDTGAQLGSHYQLVAWRNYLSCFSYYVPVNTAKNTFLARASQSWLMFGVRSCMGPDLSHLTHRDPWCWLLPPACLQWGREHSFAVWGRAPTCQAWLVAPICNLLPLPATSKPTWKTGAPVTARSCATAPSGGSWMSRQPGVPWVYVGAWRACKPQIPSNSLSDPVIFWKFNMQRRLGWKLVFLPELSGLATGEKVEACFSYFIWNLHKKSLVFTESSQAFSEVEALLREL